MADTLPPHASRGPGRAHMLKRLLQASGSRMCERDSAARPHCTSCVALHLCPRARSQGELIPRSHPRSRALEISWRKGWGEGEASRQRRGCAHAGPFALFPALALSCFLLLDLGFLALPCPRGCPERASAVEWGLESELTCERRAREVRAEGTWSKGFYEGIL